MLTFREFGLVTLAAALLSQTAAASSLPSAKEILCGYDTTISGATITYPSPIAAATNALLSRATDGKSVVTWRTQPVPLGLRGRPVTFVWLAGLGCNLGENSFTLRVNGSIAIRFTTSPHDTWEAQGTSGARLQFRTVMVDRNRDRFGFMQISLPPRACTPGMPVEIQITGEAEKSPAWVMTFTHRLADGIAAATRPVLLRTMSGTVQPLDLEIVNISTPTKAVIRVTGIPETTLDAAFGITRYAALLTPVAKTTNIDVALDMAGVTHRITATVHPVRPWTLYLVQHTHTDIGYTRPQTEILAEHLRYIDYALDYCDQTDSYPDEAKFRWTCETSWAVREYLKSRPLTQVARLKKRVLEGRIELTGMLLNWAEVADENALVHSLASLGIMKKEGLPVVMAMQDDVNGFAWCLVDYFSDLGIKFVSSGINAARALKPFKVPTPFWWESPSGKRVLAFRADHYMTGNFQNIHTREFELIERELPAYLQRLESDGYPYDRISIQYSGYFTDNSPPSTFTCENIRRWNETYAFPRLRAATMSEFLRWVEAEHGNALPAFRVAWPDWWTDGYGCAVRETAVGRQTQNDLIVNQGLLAIAGMLGATPGPSLRQQVESVADNLHFYNEHTFGAAESISDPLAENSQTQWAEKASYVWQAAMQSRLLREGAMGQIQPFLGNPAEPTIAVFNTLNWKRSGLHVLYVDNQILPKDRTIRVLDESGAEVPLQLLQSRPEGNYWALLLPDVPALGYATFRIVTGPEARTPDSPYPPSDTIETPWYRIVLDPSRGTVKSLLDREMGQELQDSRGPWQLGEFIYERLSDRSPMEALQLGAFTRTPLRSVRINAGTDGPIWRSLIVSGSSDGFANDKGITCEIRAFKTIKRIDFVFRGRKTAVNNPEGAYVAFPFALPGGRLLFEAQGGVVQPGVNQLPMTATDWNTVQSFAAVRGPSAQIVLVSDELPLMQFGGINTGRYQPDARPASQQIYSWVLNNYWTTNFRSSQEGEMVWSYSVTSGSDTSNLHATRFGWSSRIPFVSRVLPKSTGAEADPRSRSLWPFKESSLLLVSARPTADGMILHLRESAGHQARLELAPGWEMLCTEEVNALGDHIRSGVPIAFRPFEVKFVRVWK